MRKITDFIINKRYAILIIFIFLTVFCALLSSKVKINYDIAKYLPDTSQTRIGMDIMEEEFSETSTLNVMFENLAEDEKETIKENIENIEGVESVEHDDTSKYNKENYSLYVISVDDKSDSNIAKKVYNQVLDNFKNYTVYTSGDISQCNKTVLPFWIIVLAVLSALVILIIMCESYVEPFLFLISILMAVVLNKGTNIMFSSVSNITNSIAAILQMALSMDYSIMLMNRYDQEKQNQKDKVKAMKNALYKAFSSISSSSITTIVGLLALIFMSFKIGKDLGFVLAKGVLFSLICIFFVLPALILMFDKWIEKTKKKSPNIKLRLLGKYSYKIRYISLPIFILVFIASFVLKGNLGIDYTDKQSDEISKIFSENNQIAIIYENKDENIISKYLKELEDEDKIDEVLGYGNTINEKLKYDELKEKLNDLGSQVDIEDYMLKIVYYDYQNKSEDNKMTFDEFVTFIEEEAYNNEKANKKIDENIKKDITRLKNFITQEAINSKRSSEDIANILEIDKSKIEDIFIYYLSKNNDIKISLPEFVSFMNKDVLTDQKYASRVDNTNKNRLNTLTKFVDSQTLNTSYTSDKLAELFDIDTYTMNEIYKYYILTGDIEIKLSISDFSNFVLNNVVNDSNYKDSLDDKTIQQINLLSKFSNLDIINTSKSIGELSNLFNIDNQSVAQLLLLKYSNINDGSSITITQFINNVLDIANTTNYLNGVDVSALRKLEIFSRNENNINSTKLDKATLKTLFDPLREGLVDLVYMFNGLSVEEKLTPQEFVNMVCDIVVKYNINLDSATSNNLQLLKLVIDDSVSGNNVGYTAEQMSMLLNIDVQQMYKLYSLINYVQGNIINWNATPIEFVNLILENREQENVKNSIDENTINQLQLLSNVMNSANNNITYSYQELAQFLGIDNNTAKSIYTLYVSINNNLTLTPKQFVDFMLLHKNDSMISNKLSNSMINDLHLLQNVINGIFNNSRYNEIELSNLLGVNSEELSLLYGLYDFKYVNSNLNISMKEFVSFLLNEVVVNEEFSGNFTEEQIEKLSTVNSIMDATLNNTTFTSSEIFAIINKLSDEVEKNTIDMLYTYYGSEREYNYEWKMTVEEFVNFLNQDVLKDERFDDFIDEDMKADIIEADTQIKDAKKLLIGNKYSRIILNTNLDMESQETFDFIQKIKDMLQKDMTNFYIIGNSPMAYDMSMSFNDELNGITIITMIAIFIVVAITFKSILIPIILVLTIQTAVYMTMGILSIMGENVYFISILIVQSILMGATIDYAIVYTSYYIENRKTQTIKEAIFESYSKSLHTILTSSSILILVTLIIAKFSSAIAAKICKTISEGTLCSTILILTLLPAVLACCDRIIIKNKAKKEKQ